MRCPTSRAQEMVFLGILECRSAVVPQARVGLAGCVADRKTKSGVWHWMLSVAARLLQTGLPNNSFLLGICGAPRKYYILTSAGG